MESTTDIFPSSFTDWIRINRRYTVSLFNHVVTDRPEAMFFPVAWKSYEVLTKPNLYALLFRQYPILFKVRKDYQRHLRTEVEVCLFNTAEFAWDMVQQNKIGRHPADVYGDLYPMAAADMNSPEYNTTIYDENNPPTSKIERFGEVKGWKMANEANADTRRAIAFLNNFNNQVIQVLEEYLLDIMPRLLSITPDWWKMYKFLLISRCNKWRDGLNEMQSMAEWNMSAHWLDKPFAERIDEISRRQMEDHAKKYPRK
jgi:hypothetical protein